MPQRETFRLFEWISVKKKGSPEGYYAETAMKRRLRSSLRRSP
jgi:hypothetical protein